MRRRIHLHWENNDATGTTFHRSLSTLSRLLRRNSRAVEMSFSSLKVPESGYTQHSHITDKRCSRPLQLLVWDFQFCSITASEGFSLCSKFGKACSLNCCLVYNVALMWLAYVCWIKSTHESLVPLKICYRIKKKKKKCKSDGVVSSEWWSHLWCVWTL